MLYLTIEWPSLLLPLFSLPSPLAPHIPWHSLPPLPAQVARRLRHGVGAYVFHLNSPPHLCACWSCSLWSHSTMSSCLFTWPLSHLLSAPHTHYPSHQSSKSQNHIPWKLTNSVTLPEFASPSMCDGFLFWPFERDFTAAAGGEMWASFTARQYLVRLQLYLLGSCESSCYFCLGVRGEDNHLPKQVSSDFLSMILFFCGAFWNTKLRDTGHISKILTPWRGKWRTVASLVCTVL